MLEAWDNLTPAKVGVLLIVGAIIIRIVIDILKDGFDPKPPG